MIVRVLLFAAARDAVGSSQLEIEMAPHASVADLKRQLADRHAVLQPILARAAVAVGQRYADDHAPLTDCDEVAIIPPVSGG